MTLNSVNCIFLFRSCTPAKQVKCLLPGHPYHFLQHLSFTQRSSLLPSSHASAKFR